MKGPTAAFALGLFLTCRADTLISGFSPGENPFYFAGDGSFGSATSNPDGTQTLLATSGGGFFLFLLHPPVDLTEGGRNTGISLRARREPDNTAVGSFALNFHSAHSSAESISEIGLEQLGNGDFTTVIVPFTSFRTGDPFGPPNPPPVFNDVRQIYILGSGIGRTEPARAHVTFDSLSAVQIPEPGTLTLICCGLSFLLLKRGRT